jgi:predicted O-methyltransferase YrrM
MRDMYSLVRRERPLCVVEVGVYAGRSLLPQALALKHNDRGVVWGIDAWSGSVTQEGTQAPSEWPWGKTDFVAVRKELDDALRGAELFPWVCLLQARSQDAVHRFQEESIDILHIDGNHSEEVSTADVRNFLPKLKQGGWLWMDDTDWASVGAAYKHAQSGCDVVHDYGKYALLRKK